MTKLKRIQIFFLMFSLSLTSFFVAANAETVKAYTLENATPWDFRDEMGQMTGIDVDLINAIAKDQGFSVEIEPVPFTKLIDGVVEGDADIALLPLYITEERAEILDFTIPYSESHVAIAYQDESLDIKELADIAGLRVVMLDGLPFTDLVEEAQPASLEKVPFQFTAYSSIWNGKADIAIADEAFFYGMIKRRPEYKAKVVELPVLIEDSRVHWAVKKGNTELLEKLNAGLKKIKENGQHEQLVEKWIGSH